MAWKVLEAIFLMESPFHIGYRQIGMLAKTRYYLPGKNIWAAVTERLAQKDSEVSFPDYQSVGHSLRQDVRFSYFYTTTNPENTIDDNIPGYTEQGLKWGNKSQDGFEKCFVTSFTATAIDHNFRAAEDESLHEIELITHRTIKPNTENTDVVYLRGYIFIIENNKVDINKLSEALQRLQVGGEKRYGFGRLRLFKPLKEKFPSWCDPSTFIVKDGSFCLKEKFIPGHLDTKDNVQGLKGDIELLKGRDWDTQKGSGKALPEASLCWMPGSKLDNSTGARFELNYDGKLKQV